VKLLFAFADEIGDSYRIRLVSARRNHAISEKRCVSIIYGVKCFVCLVVFSLFLHLWRIDLFAAEQQQQKQICSSAALKTQITKSPEPNRVAQQQPLSNRLFFFYSKIQTKP